jgi:RNA ligase
MKYDFPVIDHLDDVRPAIAGRDEFIIAERDWGYVVNYMVAMTDTFPAIESKLDSIRRECRGLLFHKDGRIMSRRLHKFFNVNERDETQFHGIDWNHPHVILEKLDGSMITPVVTDAGLRWGTKMGITDVGMGAELFVAENPQYQELAQWCIDNGKTPIFEWTSRKQRIVIDYEEDNLVLIAVRDNITGEYLPYK